MINDSYGLGKDKLFRLADHKLLKELNYTPAKAKVHGQLYEHEKICGDVFVSLTLTDKLRHWGGTTSLGKNGPFPDRVFRIDQRLFYLEVETGTQREDKLRPKVERYIQYRRETKDEFHTLWLGRDDNHLDMMMDIFEELGASPHYIVASQNEFINSPLTCLLLNRFGEFTLLQDASN